MATPRGTAAGYCAIFKLHATHRRGEVDSRGSWQPRCSKRGRPPPLDDAQLLAPELRTAGS